MNKQRLDKAVLNTAESPVAVVNNHTEEAKESDNENNEVIANLKGNLKETESGISEDLKQKDENCQNDKEILVNGEVSVENGIIDSPDVSLEISNLPDNSDEKREIVNENSDKGDTVGKDPEKELSVSDCENDNEETNSSAKVENVEVTNSNVSNDSVEEKEENSVKEPDKVNDDSVENIEKDQGSDDSVDKIISENITDNKTENSKLEEKAEDINLETTNSSVNDSDTKEKTESLEPPVNCVVGDDKEEMNSSTTADSDANKSEEETHEVNDSLPVELDKCPTDTVINSASNSSGPPSLVKEVISEDNSENSVSDKLEEPMVVDESDNVNNDCKPVEEVKSDTLKNETNSDEKSDGTVPCKETDEVDKIRSDSKTNDTGDKIEKCVEKEPASVESKTNKVQSSKGSKLDLLLSKITNKAESDSQKVATSPLQPTKHATARKSFSNSSSLPSKPNQPVSLTSLTFNVKELEKKGVLDMPKPKQSKRKAFEPIKIPSPDKDKQKISPKKVSPLKSPIKSPGKNDNPFFNKQKILTRRKKKSKRSGGYKLPGEKTWKRNKSKRSEERQMKSETPDTDYDASDDSIKLTADMIVEEKVLTAANAAPELSNVAQVGRMDSKIIGQTNALDLLTKNSNKSFLVGNSGKKAKKTVKGIDPSTHRTLDNFLKTGSHAMRKNISEGPSEKYEYEARKRKASNENIIPVHNQLTNDSCLTSPDEKRRKTDLPNTSSPAQMITLMQAGSPPIAIPTSPHPILPNTKASPGGQILLAPGVQTSGQTLIQNGTLNGLPMFQLINNSTIASTQTAQFILAQSPGRPILTSSSPSPTLLQANQVPVVPQGMPVLLAPMSIPSRNGTPSHVVNTLPNMRNAVPVSLTSSHGNQVLSMSSPSHSAVQQQHSVIRNTLNMPKMQTSNGQLIDVKPKEGSVPNGLYPVTPPRTPEDQRSEAGSQDPSEEIEGLTGSVTPDKDVIPLCTCKISGASFQKVTTLVTFCQALDSVDGQVLGCCNKVTNPQLVRPSVKIPFLALCDIHRKRLRLHQCCPGCGHFCTQGKFLQCKKEGSSFIHNFHEQCQVTKNGKNYCPHCGETSNQYEVHLTIPDPKSNVSKDTKAARPQSKARIGVLDRRSASSGEETVEESIVSHQLDKSKKTLSTAGIAVGPDRYSLERVLASLENERPKKYRHLPKCLYTPAYDNDLERVIYMLEDGHDPNELYDDLDGQSALHAAAAIGSLCIVHVLIQAGASPHHQDKTLRTPLMFAAENNHADVVQYLIKANAIIDAKADDGMTALHLAAKAGHVNIINLLLDTDRLDIDVTDDGGWTPLIWAAEHTEVEAVRVLLQRKSDPNLRDSEENTTMHWAAFSGSVAIAELLLAAGCDLDSLNTHGDRPLHIAARQDHYELVVVFLARGADVEAKNNKGETPLECCIEQNTAVYLALKVNKKLKSFGAKHMGKPDKLIHRDLSKGRENIPIPCVNGVDDEGEPRDYLYVTDNIETTCLNINRVIGSLQTCQCRDDCSSIYCACGKNSIKCWYDKYNRLIPEFNMLEPPLIFECNRACECWTTCNNRVVQNGVMSRLQVFKTVGRGWGCKTLVDIQRGTFICEYIGEHISDSEADRREDDSYLFDLDNRDGETYCIDARKYGNVARFINHLCEPNLTPVKVFVDSQDLRFPRICLFANRDIKAQEELGFDYGEKFWIIKWKQFTCTCGSTKCRYSKDTIQKTLEEYRQRHEIDDNDSQD
ncbi:Histone-lysine N-methyltransferase ehmt1 [Mactra antiquata]